MAPDSITTLWNFRFEACLSKLRSLRLRFDFWECFALLKSVTGDLVVQSSIETYQVMLEAWRINPSP
ncbi:hypothetical protein H6F51_24765 [Cyanobacteria bacterium FACHB-DQ100]|nr:hypothetical protein [Cyanobacteria bacterium FACHB-DQ100]